jgi:hypothetical protein
MLCHIANFKVWHVLEDYFYYILFIEYEDTSWLRNVWPDYPLTQRYIPEEGNPQLYRCGNLKTRVLR